MLCDNGLQVRETLEQLELASIGDKQIGTVLIRSPKGADGLWPHECVREIIEGLGSEDLESGFYFGLINNRGVVTRKIGEGGEQELELGGKYERYATALAASAPRTAAVFRALGRRYRADSVEEDQRRDLREFY